MHVTILLLGFFSSVLASLIGSFSGGGVSLILFPLLLLAGPGSYASLLTTSKVSATVMTFVSGKIHLKKHTVDKKLLAILIVCGLLGTSIGTYLVQYQLHENVFKLMLGFVLVATAVYLFFVKNIGTDNAHTKKVEGRVLLSTVIFSMSVNILNGLFGGTGIFITLFLVIALRMTFIQGIAYSFISYAVINLMQTGYLLSTESTDIALTIVIILGSIIGTWVGTHLQYLKGNKWVKIASVSMMLIIGLRMLANIYLYNSMFVS